MFATIMQLNVHLFMVINGLVDKSAMLNDIMIFAAKYLVYIVPLYLLFLWLTNKNWNRSKPILFYIFSSILVSIFIGWGIRMLYFHPRPSIVGLGTQLIQYISGNSFPSGHATFMFAAAFLLFFIKDIRNGIFLFIISFLVGFARVFCGVHFSFDIFGSMIFAIIVATIIFVLMKKMRILQYKPPYRTIQRGESINII